MTFTRGRGNGKGQNRRCKSKLNTIPKPITAYWTALKFKSFACCDSRARLSEDGEHKWWSIEEAFPMQEFAAYRYVKQKEKKKENQTKT